MIFAGKKQSGTTLIEVLVAIFLLAIISISIFGMFLLSGRLVSDAKVRTIGLYLANEEMEKIKAMDYARAGTEGGVPGGDLPQEKEMSKGGASFTVRTEIKYLDDESDGVFPDDVRPADYKVIRIGVGWDSSFQKNEIALVSSVYPASADDEEAGGILSINAVDFEGAGVPQCEVDILEPGLSPAVEIHTRTDDYGNVILYGMPESLDGYQIYLKRSGYEEVRTYPPYPATWFHPVDEHPTVMESDLNMKSIRIDEMGELKIGIKDQADNGISGFSVAIKGGRILGYTQEMEPQPVYVFQEDNLIADESGVITVQPASAGGYEMNLNDGNYELVQLDTSYPFELPAGQTKQVEAKCVRKEVNSLLVEVLDSATREAIPEAAVTVNGPNFSGNKVTDNFGRAFFWQEIMESGDYTIDAAMDGYENYNGLVALNQLTKKEILLERQ
ncbi:MAG: prepilin-type N-terminal cleavage/methylation domain-containing protein [Patescibacteria group bacterium]|nr:prepilin-type N-terminal cleavage/methylation domain-containing protein [Patescibacteria group bacterium]